MTHVMYLRYGRGPIARWLAFDVHEPLWIRQAYRDLRKLGVSPHMAHMVILGAMLGAVSGTPVTREGIEG